MKKILILLALSALFLTGCEMQVSSPSPQPESKYTPTQTTTNPSSNNESLAKLLENIPLTGTYELMNDGSNSLVPCFSITKPLEETFCFSNEDQAKKLLGTDKTTATIIISNFLGNSQTEGGDVPNYATLVSVSSKAKSNK